jgi:UDP-2,3-diacylglucosamine hydrolase
MPTLFISDLHLSAHQPAMTRLFLHFLNHQARQAEALYILGDLFETWIGDDNQTRFNTTIIASLEALVAAGVTTYFMPGNRDFLIGRRFIQQTGCRYLADPSVIDLYGQSVLLTHGDSLCTLDKNYLRYRRWSRYPSLQWLFLKLPLMLRQKIANRLRRIEHTITPENNDQYDVVMDHLLQCLNQYPNNTLIIHGHTHQPCIQLIQHESHWIKRFVLSDWQDSQGNVLVALPNQSFELVYFS